MRSLSKSYCTILMNLLLTLKFEKFRYIADCCKNEFLGPQADPLTVYLDFLGLLLRFLWVFLEQKILLFLTIFRGGGSLTRWR